MENYKANIKITLRKGILDVQGKQVEKSLHSIGYENIEQVRIGKYVTLLISAINENDARDKTNAACKELIANPIIEDFDIELEKV